MERSHVPSEHSGSELERCRQRLKELEQHQLQIVELLACGSPDQIEHKLRNLIHEVQLLRILANQTGQAD